MELSFLSGQIELILNLKEVSMAYSDFKTLEQVHKKLGITIQDANGLYTHIEPVKLTDWFVETIEMAYPKAIRINTESARQALIVDNVFMELNRHIHISFFLHNTFNVDDSKGLTGNPDGIISQSRNQLYITCPVIVLVEAKKSDLGSGLGQCIAEMEGARTFVVLQGYDYAAANSVCFRSVGERKPNTICSLGIPARSSSVAIPCSVPSR